MNRKTWIIVAVVIGVVVAGFGWSWLARPLIPRDVRRQVSFAMLYPGNNNPAQIDRASIRYDSGNRILTYNAKLDGAKLVVSNQSTPETFTDIPQYFDKVVERMHPFLGFDSVSGKVQVTRPPNSNNQQVAITNTRGTLMFVRTDHDLSEDQWRKFFNNLRAD